MKLCVTASSISWTSIKDELEPFQKMFFFPELTGITDHGPVYAFVNLDSPSAADHFETTCRKEGDIVVGTAYGTLRMTGPSTNKSEGEIIYMTQSPKLSWLNNKKCRLEGTGDAVTGEAHVKVFAL